MNIWVVCISEPLPIDGGGQRLMRAGMLTRALLSMGHEVTWWTSAFNHSSKRHRTDRSQVKMSPDGVRLWLMHGIEYSRNIGVCRLINHLQLAFEFRRLAAAERPPDVIFCCWPAVEVGFAAVRYAERRSIPVLLDVRDLWPDIYLDAVLPALRPAARIALAPYYRMTRSAFRRASGIVAISEGYLDWGLAQAGRKRGRNDALFPLGYQEPDWKKAHLSERNENLLALGSDDSRLLCWFLGSFGDTYDLESVIRAARKLRNQGAADCLFVLSGEGEKRVRLEKMADGMENVVFTGWLNAEQIACMMEMAHIGLAAYRESAPQGLPNKIFEYMAAGLPILSSLSGECKRFLQTNACGISYAAGSADSFIDGLLTLRADENLRKEMGTNGLRAFRSRYSASVVYPQLAKYLERIAAEAPKTRPFGRAAIGRPRCSL
jgi:glycosyltransferase involved in cell wall biosynthesis